MKTAGTILELLLLGVIAIQVCSWDLQKPPYTVEWINEKNRYEELKAEYEREREKVKARIESELLKMWNVVNGTTNAVNPLMITAASDSIVFGDIISSCSLILTLEDGTQIEPGFRSDGVVVWREVGQDE